VDDDDEADGVIYDEIDSLKMVNEEVEALMLQDSSHSLVDQLDVEPDHGDVHIIGSHVERYTGQEFSSCAATNWWVEWDAAPHT